MTMTTRRDDLASPSRVCGKIGTRERDGDERNGRAPGRRGGTARKSERNTERVRGGGESGREGENHVVNGARRGKNRSPEARSRVRGIKGAFLCVSSAPPTSPYPTFGRVQRVSLSEINKYL